MQRFLSLALSFAASFTLISATAATAAPATGAYAAKPAAAAAGRMVIRDTIWQCGDAGCASAMQSKSRAALVCSSLVKEVGALNSFRAGDTEFDADALAKCNARASTSSAQVAQN